MGSIKGSEMQFRSFSSQAKGWQGNVKLKGAEAIAGKVGQGPLFDVFARTFPLKHKTPKDIEIFSIKII